MHFGLTQFGRPLAASLVTAAGLAVCAATATAEGLKTRFGGGAAKTQATVTVTPKRTAQAAPARIDCAASAKGTAAVTVWSVSSAARAVATFTGRSQVDFFAPASVANVYGRASAQAHRDAKVVARAAQAFASIEGEGYIFEIAYPGPARATAWAFGTTYQTGWGQALSEATISGRASWEAGATGRAVAGADAEADWVFIAGAEGAEGGGRATASGDAAVRRNGVLEFEAVGVAKAAAVGTVAVLAIYQAQTAHAYATLEQSSIHTRGARGQAAAHAEGVGDANVVGTAAALSAGFTQAAAFGNAQIQMQARGAGNARAAFSAAPQVIDTRVPVKAAVVSAHGSGSPVVRNTKVYPDTAYGVANGSARQNRILTTGGEPVSTRSEARNASVVRTRSVVAVGLAQAKFRVVATKTMDAIGVVEVMAYATATVGIATQGLPARGVASVETLGSRRVHSGQGICQAEADAQGWNQVNDLLRAPPERIAVVTDSPRRVEIAAENRQLAA